MKHPCILRGIASVTPLPHRGCYAVELILTHTLGHETWCEYRSVTLEAEDALDIAVQAHRYVEAMNGV